MTASYTTSLCYHGYQTGLPSQLEEIPVLAKVAIRKHGSHVAFANIALMKTKLFNCFALFLLPGLWHAFSQDRF